MPVWHTNFAPMAAETTEDAVLGGRLILRQPRRGHRVGHDAILLAAATNARAGEHAIDLGAGVGAAGLALARRIAGVKVTLVEIESTLKILAAENAQRNNLADRARAVLLDVTAPDAEFAKVGLASASAAHVLMNPPFNNASRQNLSPDPRRRLAHTASSDTLTLWMRRAAMLLAHSGTLTLIWRADGLGDVLAAARADFGCGAVLPVHPRPNAAAIRVLVRAVRGSRAPLALMPGLTLNDADGRPTTEAEAILRGGEALKWPGFCEA